MAATAIMSTRLIAVVPARRASAAVGVFDHAENTKAAAQATRRKMRIGVLL
jgi:hypothetical protein